MGMTKKKYQQLESARRRMNSQAHDMLPLSKYSVEKLGLLQPRHPIDYDRVARQYPKGSVLYGIELEAEYSIKPSILAEPLKLLGGGYITTDGSLRNNGVEFVLQPRTQKDIQSCYGEIRKGLNFLSAAGMRSHDTEKCGLHVHVTRTAMADGEWGLLKLFMQNERDFFKKISRRQSFSFCEFTPNRETRKYEALNLCPEYTREFRFFRGTLLPDSYFAAIECVSSLVEYQRFIKENTGTLKGYKAFLKTGRYHYLENTISRFFPVKGTRHYEKLLELETQKKIAQRNALKEVRRNQAKDFLIRCARQTSESEYCALHNCTRVNAPLILGGRWPAAYRDAAAKLIVSIYVPQPYILAHGRVSFILRKQGGSINECDFAGEVTHEMPQWIIDLEASGGGIAGISPGYGRTVPVNPMIAQVAEEGEEIEDDDFEEHDADWFDGAEDFEEADSND